MKSLATVMGLLLLVPSGVAADEFLCTPSVGTGMRRGSAINHAASSLPKFLVKTKGEQLEIRMLGEENLSRFPRCKKADDGTPISDTMCVSNGLSKEAFRFQRVGTATIGLFEWAQFHFLSDSSVIAEGGCILQ
jgi:hypothetical protein